MTPFYERAICHYAKVNNQCVNNYDKKSKFFLNLDFNNMY